jgi:hypothetical protein
MFSGSLSSGPGMQRASAVGTHRAAGIGDAVAGLELGDAFANGLDDAGAFEADAGWQRQRVEPGAVIGIDEVEADRGMAHANLPRARFAQVDILPAQYLGPAGRVKTDRLYHRSCLHGVVTGSEQTSGERVFGQDTPANKPACAARSIIGC